MEKVKVGIVGCGGIANGKHLPSLKKLHNVEFVAFCDIVIEKAKKANQDFADGKALVFEDYHDLINIQKLMLYMFVRQMYHIVKLLVLL